jgi:RecB family exonuclease
MQKIQGGERGWKTPALFSFNRWVMGAFRLLWEPFRPLPRLSALRLWSEAVQRVGVPEGLKQGPSLSMELQETLDILTRNGQELGGPSKGFALADWRREVSRHFLDSIESRQYIVWTELLRRVGEAVRTGRISLPEEIILAGFDEWYPAERHFVGLLSEKSKVVFWQASKKREGQERVRVFATPEQECQAVCAEVLREWNKGQKHLGVVLLDPDDFGLLKRCFEELTDREERTPDGLRYNLASGTPLSEHPLFQTAMIPLRLPDEPDPAPLLSSLLCSPYVRILRDDWERGVRTRLWNLTSSSSVGERLRDLIRRLQEGGYAVESLQTFVSSSRKPMREWLEGFERLWKPLGFPVCKCETDTLSKEHLFSIIEQLRKEAGDLEVGRGELMAWFSAASQGIEVVESTPETAGIQVLNLVEARGLAFDHLWVVGTHGRALPRPIPEYPFVDPDELRNIQGGTAEWQWAASERNISYLLAAAPHISFSRAVSQGEEAPYLPCPLIPDEDADEACTIDLWKEPPPEWLRARWLREGLKGLQGRPEEEQDTRQDEVKAEFPKLLEVTSFEDLLLCPFRFFAKRLLRIEPLEEALIGIEPSERGTFLHQVLQEFVAGLAVAAPDWPDDKGEAIAFLVKTVDHDLSQQPDDPFWKTERSRLLGDDRSPGLLIRWIEEERDRAREGWRFESAEGNFENLALGETGVALKGRVDRMDHHPKEGKALWDYKTGEVPPNKEVLETMVRPQIPAYLLSLKQGLLRGRASQTDQVETGYISLRKASEVKHIRMKSKDWKEFFDRWEEWIRERLKKPLLGVYPTDPKPPPSERKKGACKHCSYPNLCGIETLTLEGIEGSDEPEDRP